jgi:hypothetical protein
MEERWISGLPPDRFHLRTCTCLTCSETLRFALCAIKATKRGIPSPDLYVFNVFRNLALCALALLMAQSAERRESQHVKDVQVWTGIPSFLALEAIRSAKRRAQGFSAR